MELITQTNHSSQNDVVQLLFKSQLESVLIQRYGQILKSQRRNCFFYHEQDRHQIPPLRLNEHRPESIQVIPPWGKRQATKDTDIL